MKPIHIDGKANEISWSKVPWTDDFIDIEGDEKANLSNSYENDLG